MLAPHSPHASKKFSVVRARFVMPLRGETIAAGMHALTAPLEILNDAVIVAKNGVIVAVESYKEYMRRANAPKPEAFADLGDILLVPGTVNCHTHLEISHMSGKTLWGEGFHPWLASLITLDKTAADSSGHADTALHALDAALADMAASGTSLVGDISSRIPQTVLAASQRHAVQTRLFLEVIGPDLERVRRHMATAASDPAFSLAGHALYTTPGDVVAKAKAWCVERELPFSMHLAEHMEEEECLATGGGAFSAMMREKILPPDWRPPQMRPVQYAARLGLLSPGVMATHCVQCDDKDIDTLAASGAAVCLCPRSNAAIGVGEAPARALAEKGVPLVLGTDSLASNADLCVWNEAEYFLEKNILPANALLRMATVNGAAVLGFQNRYGRLEKGTRFCYKTFPSEMIALFR